MPLSVSIGERIRVRREELGMTQLELAEKSICKWVIMAVS